MSIARNLRHNYFLIEVEDIKDKISRHLIFICKKFDLNLIEKYDLNEGRLNTLTIESLLLLCKTADELITIISNETSPTG